MSRWTQALAALLPPGHAWPRHPDSVLMRVIASLAAGFEEAHDFIQWSMTQWLPHLTIQRLEEWEDAAGLPDESFGTKDVQGETLRRLVLLSRLRGVPLPYTDSSPANVAVLTAYCVALGYDTVITYVSPGVLNVVVRPTTEMLRVGAARCGGRLRGSGGNAATLFSALDRIAPARYELNITSVS